MSYFTITAGFNASGENAKLLPSTAWLFKTADPPPESLITNPDKTTKPSQLQQPL